MAALWHTSIKNRLTFLFFAITAGAILVIYFYVVPQLESNLTSQKLDALERDSPSYSRPLQDAIGREVTAAQLDALTRAHQRADRRPGDAARHPRRRARPRQRRARSPPYVISDSQRRADAKLAAVASTWCSRRPAPGRREDRRRAPRAAASSPRPRGRSSTRASRPGWSCSRSRSTTCSDNVALIQRQILVAGADRAAGRDRERLLRRQRARAPRQAARARRRRGRGRQLLRRRSRSTPRTSSGQLAQAFNEMQRQLARLDTARKEFIANASHELRTPIFSLGGFVELLQDEDLDEETRAEFLATMREQVDRLQKLTTDLLDLSRLDAGSLELRAGARAAAARWRNQVAGEFAAAAARKGADDRGRRPRAAEVDVEAICDPQRVAQIVRVLLDNALGTRPTERTSTIAARTPARPDGGARPPSCWSPTTGPGIRRRELAARVRALPHRRLRPGLGPRPRDRARAGATGWAATLEVDVPPGPHRLHAHAAARAAERARRRRRAPPGAAASRRRRA